MRKILVTVIALFLIASASYAAEVKEYVLPNGLKVLIREDHKAPLAVFQIWYRVGSRNEVSGKTGLGHLLEHMMFKGTKEHPSKELSITVQRNGGIDNAYTSKDRTVYFQQLPSDRLWISLEFESDRMRNLLLDDAAVLSEKNVVMEERRLRYEDDPQNALYETFTASAFLSHPYRNPIIGWMSDLESITPRDLREHYEKYYSPDNAFIIVVGDVEPDALIKEIKKSFGRLKPSEGRRASIPTEPPQSGERRVALIKEAALPYVAAGYHAPSFPHPDSFALEVLASILSEGRSSRLYKTMVYEKKMALSAEGYYSGDMIDPFLFILEATAAPGFSISDVEAELYNVTARLVEEGPTEFELQKARNQLEAMFIMSQDSIQAQAGFIGAFELLGGWRLMDEYIRGIRAVTADDIKRVGAKYLAPENRTVGILVPKEAGR